MLLHFRFLNSLSIICLLAAGCSQRILVRMSTPLISAGFESLSEEGDLQLAEHAAAANLKLLDAAIKTDPNNKKLLQLACRGYSGFALAFVPEDENERARDFYGRARSYGLRALKRDRRFRTIGEMTTDELKAALRKCVRRDVPRLFWPALAWGFWINLSRDKPAALAELPKVEAIMERVIELDERYFHGGPHLFFGTIYGSRTRMLGGDPVRAKKHFERNIEISGGKFLLTYYFQARYLAIQNQDREAFEQLLNKVEDAPSDLLPEQRLLNSVARRRASDLLLEVDDYF